jgi:uncharacterized membrane protein YkoI
LEVPEKPVNRRPGGACQQIDSFNVAYRGPMRKMAGVAAILGVVGLVLAAPPVHAGDHGGDRDNDHDRARDLYERGEIHALADILRTVSERAPGDIIGIDLIKVGDKWVYRFQIVAADGHRMVVDVDAGAGTILTQEAGD